MRKEPEPMEEIHKIRAKLYEEHKNLTVKEHVAKVHEEAEEAIRRYGIKIKHLSHVG
ncbi:MAG: hypothetical protein HY920_09130 [Elusimicrobia bacterium]|nr:hypothetical protein [Elusimicrobiota bacterium]